MSEVISIGEINLPLLVACQHDWNKKKEVITYSRYDCKSTNYNYSNHSNKDYNIPHPRRQISFATSTIKKRS